MDLCDGGHSLINLPTDKLSFISVVNSEPVRMEANELEPKFDSVDEKVRGSVVQRLQGEEPKQKLRKRNPENWKQNVRKRNKNKGLEYVTVNGKICEKKKLGPPCTCKEKCYLKIGLDACEKIFQNFWKLGDHALQNAYIAGCVRIFLPKHCYKKDGVPSRRFFSRNFHVTVNGVDTEVCKQAFLNIHAVSNGRLDRLLKKKQEIGNTGFDERGRHNNKVNKIPAEKIQMVRKHIDSVREKAGYIGKRKPKRVELLPGVLNIRTMYCSYKEEMLLKGLEPVCEYRYRKIFHTDFHLDFGKTTVLNSSLRHQKCQQTQREAQETQAFLPQIYCPAEEKKLVKICLKNDNEKKMEGSTNVTLKDMNLNVHMSAASLKTNKEFSQYPQLGIHWGKQPDPNSYSLQQDVFRLDCTNNYTSSSQQGWIFANQT